MQGELLRARRMNKEYIDFTTDSVMKEVAAYYDRHGSPNERMEAHYLLGCAYRDLGEAPRAIDCYLDAAACANTTATDCDFYTMSSIYGQMATLYHQQLLLSYEVEAHRKACRYNYLAGDTLYALHEQKLIAGAYILQNKRDSAEFLLNDVIRHFRERGCEQEALQASTMLMHLLIYSPGRQTELKQLIGVYDTKCKSFDENHELPSSARLFYYYKGKYFENTGQLDSAEVFYHKLYSPGMSSMFEIYYYKGMYNVYSKKGVTDSIAKYAQLYCEVNDSTVSRKDQEVTAQMAASYNYNHYQKEAQKNERKAHRTELLLIALGIVLCVIVAAGIYAARLYKRRQLKKRKALEEEHSRKVEQLRETHRQELARLENLFQQKEGERIRMEEIYHKVTEAIRKELDSAKSENQSMRENYGKARRTIEEINLQYEKDKAALNDEIHNLEQSIAKLKERDTIADRHEMERLLLEADIIVKLKSRADSPGNPMTNTEFDTLEDTYATFFPLFLQGIKQVRNISRNDKAVAMLTALGLKPGQIQCLTELSSSKITNSKTKINKDLFGESSASTLYNNLSLRYGF